MKKTLLLLFMLVCCSQIAFSQKNKASEFLRNSEKSEYVLIAAHRGDWQYAPENSMLSLQHDIDWGVDLIETDVHLTKDDKLIIMHDFTVDRTTNGSGKISDMTLAQIKELNLINNIGGTTDEKVPTLEEYIQLAKGKVILYLDKAGMEKPGTESGYKIKKILELLRKYDSLEESVFVLDFPYEKARAIFGSDLEKVNYIPVIEDYIPNLSEYVDEYIQKLRPVAFQFRFATLESTTYRQLPKVLASTSKAFVASTWPNHTANHDDYVSIFKHPSMGWGWLIEKGFRVLETNYPKDLIQYLKYNNYRK